MKTTMTCLMIAVLGRFLFEVATAEPVRLESPADAYANLLEGDQKWSEPTPLPGNRGREKRTPTPSPTPHSRMVTVK